MLRVITERYGRVYVLALHGILDIEGVAILEQHWRSIMEAEALARIIVVLSEVEFIAPEGESLLDRMANEGADFVVSGCMNRYVLEKLERARRRRVPATPPGSAVTD